MNGTAKPQELPAPQHRLQVTVRAPQHWLWVTGSATPIMSYRLRNTDYELPVPLKSYFTSNKSSLLIEMVGIVSEK